MFCMCVNSFKDKPIEEEINTWPKIQQFISAHITKYMSEILCNIKNKIFIDFN
jgi:hypothetical protein